MIKDNETKVDKINDFKSYVNFCEKYKLNQNNRETLNLYMDLMKLSYDYIELLKSTQKSTEKLLDIINIQNF